MEDFDSAGNISGRGSVEVEIYQTAKAFYSFGRSTGRGTTEDWQTSKRVKETWKTREICQDQGWSDQCSGGAEAGEVCSLQWQTPHAELQTSSEVSAYGEGLHKDEDCFAMFPADAEPITEDAEETESLFSTLQVHTELHTHEDLAFAAFSTPNQVIALLDTGASISITDSALGHEIHEMPEVRVKSVHGTRNLRYGIQHEIWGPMYLDRQANICILSASRICGSPGFNCHFNKNGTVDIHHRASGIQYSTFWRNNVLCADITTGAHYSPAPVYAVEDKYSDIRGLTLSQLKQARQARAVHRGMAFRDSNALSVLVNRGYMTGIPIDPKLFRITNALLGPPHEIIKRRRKGKRARASKYMEHWL
jgi:hypothetical protein